MLLSLDEGVPLRDALAQALHDPSLEIVYWLDDATPGSTPTAGASTSRSPPRAAP